MSLFNLNLHELKALVFYCYLNTIMNFFLEVEHVKNIFESWILIFFLFFFKSIINDNTHMDEWVYPIIVENIYHDEVKDFSMLSNILMYCI
jgi:hypothetical protein